MRRALLLLLALLFIPAGLKAQSLPPNQYALNLKGVLLNNSNQAFADGPYTVQFRLYTTPDRANPASPVYVESQSVTVFTTLALVAGQPNRKGKYVVTLGNQSGNPLLASQFVNKTLYLEIWINGQAPPLDRPRQQIVQVPYDSTTGKSMNQVVWVTNALNHVEVSGALETAALAFYVNKIYATIPNADPNFVTRALISAEDSFNQRYRDAKTGYFRIPMLPLDAIVNMYGILVQQPGNPVTLPVIGESLTFAAGSLDLRQGKYQQFSYELGRISSAGTFNDYMSGQLESLYLLARQNSNAAIVVNTFFGYGYKVKVADSLFTILDKNPDLRDSQNFAPLRPQIEADGTMLTTLDTLLANVADFYDRMTVATRTMTSAVSQMTAIQKNDYVGTSNNQNTAAQIVQAFAAANAATTPALATTSASIYATITLMDGTAYNALETTAAGLRVAAATGHEAAFVAATIAGGIDAKAAAAAAGQGGVELGDLVRDGIDSVAGAFDVGAALIDLALTQTPGSPDQITQDALTQISDQLQGVQQQLNSRLDIIDANIATLYTQMDTDFRNLRIALVQGLSSLSTRVDQLVQDVVHVQYTLDRLTQNFSTFASQSQRATNLVPYLTEINNWTNPNQPKPSSDVFNTDFSRCQTYATSTALQPGLENGNLNSDGFASQYGDVQVLDQLDSNQEKNLNYLLAFAYHRFWLRENAADSIFIKPVDSPAFLHNQGTSIANLTAWEMSSLGMMRAATIYPDLGLPYVQASNSGFQAAFNIGTNIQTAANRITLQFRAGSNNTIVEPSPILTDMLTHHHLMAQNLYNALYNAQFNLGDPHDAAHLPAQLSQRVANVLYAYNDTSSAVSQATKALDGSSRLLEQFIEFGLSRSIKSNDVMKSLLYSQGDPNFRDPQNNLAADPNAQRLPDGAWVQAQYHNWVSSQPSGGQFVTGDPLAIFNAAENGANGNLGRNDAMGQMLTTTLGNLATNANRNQIMLGEPLADIEAIQNRLAYFLIPTVSGTVSGKAIPNLPANAQPKSLANTAITMFFSGVNSFFTAPVLLDAQGRFTVYVPKDLYTLFVKAPSFLQSKAQAPGQVRGVINTQGDPNNPINDQAIRTAIHNVTVSLIVGDVTGNNVVTGSNVIDSADLIAVRNAMGSRLTIAGWDARFDFNGDEVVDVQDQILLEGALNTTPNDTRWNAKCDFNGDNKVDSTDQATLFTKLGTVSGGTGWDPKYDLNGDGIVDYKDQEILQGKVGTNGTSINWDSRFDLVPGGGVDVPNDVALFLTKLGTRKSSLNWNPVADLNGDGVVDNTDMIMLRANLGLHGEN